MATNDDVREPEDFLRLESGDGAQTLLRGETVRVPEQFKVIDRLGEGGAGVVYKARNVYTGQVVAIKTLKSGHSDVALQRMQREAKAACSLIHPHIVRAYDFGLLDGHPFLIMEYVEGETLDKRIARLGRLSALEALPIFKQMAMAAQKAHAEQIVHRDLKPANVILHKTDGGEVAKVLDFGIAKIETAPGMTLTQTGEVFGTPLYMSPEQFKGDPVDARSDIYSLGAIMYEALGGKPPHIADAAFEVMFKRLTDKPKSFDDLGIKVPPGLERIVFKCLQVDPAERYLNAGALLSDLDRFEAAKGIAAFAPAAAKALSSKEGSFQRWVIISLGVALAAGTAFGINSVWENWRVSQKSGEAQGLINQGDFALQNRDFNLAREFYAKASTYELPVPAREHVLKGGFDCAMAESRLDGALGYLNELIKLQNATVENVPSETRLAEDRNKLVSKMLLAAKNCAPSDPVKTVRYFCAAWDCAETPVRGAGQSDDVLDRLIDGIFVFVNALIKSGDEQAIQIYIPKITKMIPQIHDLSVQTMKNQRLSLNAESELHRQKSMRAKVHAALGWFYSNHALLCRNSDPGEAQQEFAKSDEECKKAIAEFDKSKQYDVWVLTALEQLQTNALVARDYQKTLNWCDYEVGVAQAHTDDPSVPQHLGFCAHHKALALIGLGRTAEAEKYLAPELKHVHNQTEVDPATLNFFKQYYPDRVKQLR